MARKRATAPAANSAQPVAGKNFKVYVNVGATAEAPTWLELGGQRGGDLTRKADSLDASHKGSGGWKTTIPGLKEWSIDLETIYMPNDEGLQVLEDAFLADQQINVKFEYPNRSYVTGWASIVDLSISAPHDDVATCKGSLVGVGALSELKTA